MSAHQSRPDEERGRVLPFVRRKPMAGRGQALRPGEPVIDDVGKYARAGDDDYRHRMTMNGLAFLILAVLVVAGVWLAVTIAEMRKNQDCVLTGRKGCTPVTSQTINHY